MWLRLLIIIFVTTITTAAQRRTAECSQQILSKSRLVVGHELQPTAPPAITTKGHWFLRLLKQKGGDILLCLFPGETFSFLRRASKRIEQLPRHLIRGKLLAGAVGTWLQGQHMLNCLLLGDHPTPGKGALEPDWHAQHIAVLNLLVFCS